MPIYKGKFIQPGQSLPPPQSGLMRGMGPVLAVRIEVPDALSQSLTSKGSPVPPPVQGYALIDTGATVSAIDGSVATRLGLNPVGTLSMSTAGGPTLADLFPVKMVLTQFLNMPLNYSQVAGLNLAGVLGGQVIALLGRDFLERAILIYDGPSGEFSLAL